MTTPHFIIIGAMKCGTSTLAAQLGAQEGLFMTEPKEPNYFSDDDVFALGRDWYSALFAAAAATDLRGEASTHYTKRPNYPQTIPRLQAALGRDLRLVYMIRNPIARLTSHYVHDWSEGVLSEPLETALDTHAPLVDYGLYGWQIAPFIEAFGQEAVLLTSLERLKADPDQELARIAVHIGHQGPVRWKDDLARENVSSERIRKFPLHRLLITNPVSTALRRALIPKALRARVREGRQMRLAPDLPASARPALEARFAADRDLLAQYFPDDPSLRLAYPFLD